MATRPLPSPGPQAVPSRGRKWKRVFDSRLFSITTKFLVLPLIGTLVSAMIIGRIANTFLGPKTYSVVVVGGEGDSSVYDMMKAAAGGSYESIGDVAVKSETIDDYGDPQQAATIAQELANRPDVLMVVGHVYSTVTKSALPIYLKAKPPIPVILTTETNPTLVPSPAKGSSEIGPPVFRLFPTDTDQAIDAAKFFCDQHAKSIWVVEDTTNPTYSEYLAREFLKDVYKEHPELKVILWSNNLNLPPYSVDKLGIDWVFFAGNWQNALILVRQLKALPGDKKPKLLLSDASADPFLLKYGGDEVNGVYLLHPMSPDVFTKDGYVAVGEEASKLSVELVRKVHENFKDLAYEAAPVPYTLRKWLGLHRVSDARRAMTQYMSKAATFRLPITAGATTIEMGLEPNSHLLIRENARFHVWRIDHGRFVPVQ